MASTGSAAAAAAASTGTAMGKGGMVPTVPSRPVAQVSFTAGEAVAQSKNGTREASLAAPDKSASFAIAALAAHKKPTPPPALSAGKTLNPGPASAPTHAASPLRSKSLNQTRNKLKLAAKLGAASKEEAEKAKARAKVIRPEARRV